MIRKGVQNPEKARRVVVAAARRVRPDWQEIVSTAESIRGRSWQELFEGHGNWGRDGMVAVGKMPGVKYGALAGGVAVVATGMASNRTAGIRGADSSGIQIMWGRAVGPILIQ